MNRLANATSPYLLQHKDNPVDWFEWSDEAFAEAPGAECAGAAERGVRRMPLVPQGRSIDGFWRISMKPQVIPEGAGPVKSGGRPFFLASTALRARR